MKNTTRTTIEGAVYDLMEQLEWIKDPMLKYHGTKENNRDIAILERCIKYLDKQRRQIPVTF